MSVDHFANSNTVPLEVCGFPGCTNLAGRKNSSNAAWLRSTGAAGATARCDAHIGKYRKPGRIGKADLPVGYNRMEA